MRLFAIILASLLCTALPSRVLAAETTDPDHAGVEFFEKQIRPLLAERCYECHSARAEKVKGKLLLDSREGLRKGGEGGAIVIPGDPEKSRLITAIRFADPDMQMPPKHQLSKEEIGAFEAWVKMGAPDPRTDSPAATVVAQASYNFDEAKKFWSFQPLKEPAVPGIQNAGWALGPVDQFLAADYETHRLKPAPPADKRTLIRRATFDLTGLPPTPDEVEAFLADASPGAFEKVVDRLLASPAYGEKWGRHWLDLVRYADTSGCNSDFPIPAAYRYRNWVIEAFNKDMPYDRFLQAQLAGDLLPAKDEAEHKEQVIATGYLAIARRFGSRNNEFHLTIEDVIDNCGKTMLGLSVSCARCHDHKFDPIPNTDYYALYGIFASTKFAFPGTEIYRHTKDFTPIGSADEAKALREHEAKLAEVDDRIERLVRERDTLASREKANAGATTRPAAAPATQPGSAPTTQPARTLAQVKVEYAEALDDQRKLDFKAPVAEKAYAVSDGKPADARLQRKGNPEDRGDAIPRGFLTILGGQKLPSEGKSSGRLQLAQWITDSKNPLTARVMANRVWQNHFGVGLVKTPNDFGARGQRPTNPALLDYLASRFQAGGWSVKSMHRMLMLSAAYQLSSGDDASDYAVDPNNDYFWRQNPRRLSAEEIRDTLLAVSGTLDPAPAGPHPFPPENEWKFTQHKPYYGDYPTNHRSVYLMQQRIRKQAFLATFDGADTNAATALRPLSTTAIQALFMMNDPFLHDQADKLAVRVGLAMNDDPGRIDYAFHLCLSRPATAEELQAGQQYLHACAAKLADAQVPWDQRNRQALASYMRVLLGSNEFVFVD
ncbi:MAG: hypothetical protein JWO87_489 [Phycisphaerales bacterium]|nr:hypothetical protein [Phycisphaerales bacterium]